MIYYDITDEAHGEYHDNVKPTQAHPEGQCKQTTKNKVKLIGGNSRLSGGDFKPPFDEALQAVPNHGAAATSQAK